MPRNEIPVSDDVMYFSPIVTTDARRPHECHERDRPAVPGKRLILRPAARSHEHLCAAHEPREDDEDVIHTISTPP